MFRAFCLILPLLVFAGPPKMLPVSIKVSGLEVVPDQSHLSYLANVKSIQAADLALARSGVVDQVFAKDFTYVKKGQKILQIESSVLSAQIDSAKAQLKLSEIEFARVKKLFANKALPAAEFDKAQSNLQIAKSNHQMLLAEKSQTVLKAPFSGFIGSIEKGPGEFITAGSKITAINSYGQYYAEFYVPQEQLVNLNKLTKYVLEVNGSKYKPKFVYKDNSADPSTRLVQVKAYFDAKSIRPGFFAKVNITTGTGKDIIQVPESSVLYSSSGSYIYKMVNSKPIKTKVVLGNFANGKIKVISGLQKADKIVVVGQFKLFPNAQIQIVS